MKILYVALDVDMGSYHGGYTHVSEVSKNLDRLGHKVLVAARSHDEGVSVPWLPRRLKLTLIPYLAWLIKKHGIDLVYERASSLGAGAWASKITGKPLVSEVNDFHHSRASFDTAKSIITTSMKLVPEEYAEKTKLVSWAADVDKFNPSNSGKRIRDMFGIKQPIVLYSGSLRDWHGVEDLIRSFKGLKASLMIVGAGENLQNLKDLAESLKLDAIFTGQVPYNEIHDYIGAADICVAPFRPDAHPGTRERGIFYSPLKIFEYMASGKPVVASISGNTGKILDGPQKKLLFSPGNLDELREKIMKGLSDKNLRKRIGEENRKTAVSKYSWAAHSKMLDRLFKEAVK